MLSATDFRWDTYFWVTSARLQDERLAPTGIEVFFAPEGRGDEPLDNTEIAIVSHAIDRLDETVGTAVARLYEEYPELQGSYGYNETERAEFMPDVSSVDDFLRLLRVSSVNVHQITRNGEPYVGVIFGCTWDVEHGAGVLLNGTRIVETGGADTATLLWIAEQDLDSSEPPEQINQSPPPRRKRWWKRG